MTQHVVAHIPGDRAASVAIAVWVKTPGFTPAKTRLAQSLGTKAAEAFYRLAVDAVREVVTDACQLAPGLLAPYWAVAERDVAAHACWPDCQVVTQGEGGLGERLAHVYDLLAPNHEAVLFIGADSPQLSPEVVVHAAQLLVASPNAPEFVLGPAMDGGFYLFGGREPLPVQAWTSVTYSASTTMAELVVALERVGKVQFLASAFDVDTIDDLRLLRHELAVTPRRGAARRALQDWLESTMTGYSRRS